MDTDTEFSDFIKLLVDEQAEKWCFTGKFKNNKILFFTLGNVYYLRTLSN